MSAHLHLHVAPSRERPPEPLAGAGSALYYAELTTRGPAVGRTGELLEAQTRWVAFEDLATWPAALAANIDPRDVVRLRFPNDSSSRPAGVDARVLRVGPKVRSGVGSE